MVEEVEHARGFTIHLLLDSGQALSILTHFNEATALARGKDLVRLQPQVQLFLFEDLIEHADELDAELLLSHVIIGLDDHAHESPRQQMTVR